MQPIQHYWSEVKNGNKVYSRAYLTVFMVFFSTKVSWCKFVDRESAWSMLSETAAGGVASRLPEHEHCYSESWVWALTAPAHSLCSQPDNCAGVPPPRLDPPPACPSIAPGLINLRPAIAHRFRKQTACQPRFFSMACPDLPLRLRNMRASLTYAYFFLSHLKP